MSGVPLVSEILSPVTVTLRTDRTLDEALNFLRDYGVGAAPVLTPGGNLVGVVTEFHLLRCFLKKNQSTPAMNLLGNYLNELEGVVVIKDSETVSEAFRRLLQSPSRRVFVTDADEKLYGMVEPRDFFGMVAPAAEKSSRKRSRLRADGTDQPATVEELLFAGAPCTLHSLDFNGKIVAANFALHNLLGYLDGELVGKTLKELYPVQYHEDTTAALVKVREAGYHAPVNSAFARKDQQLVKIDLVTMLRYDDHGVPAGTVTAGWLPEQGKMAEFLVQLAEAIRPQTAPPPGPVAP